MNRIPLLAGVAALALVAAMPAAAENVLRWANQGDALTLDPHSQNEGQTTTMMLQMYEPLIRRNAKLEKEPGLAVSWRAVEGNAWEFKLRTGVKFHDGSAFSADDVVFTFERAMAPTSDFRT